MKVTVIHMPHPSVDEEAIRVAEVSIPADIKDHTAACEYAYRWTQNLMGSWSIKDGNGDNNDDVKRIAPLHNIDGQEFGLRSSMMGDEFIVHDDNAWEDCGQGSVYECAMMGFEFKHEMRLVGYGERAYAVQTVEWA